MAAAEQIDRNSRAVELKAAIRARAMAEYDLDKALKRLYPVGTEVCWQIGKRIFVGRVTMNCMGDRLQVENTHTSRRRFIHASAIV